MTTLEAAEVGYRCQYPACGVTFTRESADPLFPPLYCSPQHRRKAQEKRRQRRRRIEADRQTVVGRCPRRDKRQFRSNIEAWQFIRDRHPDEPGMFAYTCDCGAVHIGHSPRWDHSWRSVREPAETE